MDFKHLCFQAFRLDGELMFLGLLLLDLELFARPFLFGLLAVRRLLGILILILEVLFPFMWAIRALALFPSLTLALLVVCMPISVSHALDPLELLLSLS